MADQIVTQVLTGLLPLAVLIAAVLALPVSHALLRLYRRAVLVGMNRLAGAAPLPPRPAVRRRAAPPPLPVVELDRVAPVESDQIDTGHLRRVARGPWRAAAVYAGAGLAYAAVMTVGSILSDEELNVTWRQVAALFWIYWWPGILAAILVAAYDRNRRRQVLGAYFGVLLIMAVEAAVGNPDVGLLGVPTAWLLNAPATLLLMTFLARSIRAIGPMVLAFLLVAAFGSQAALWLASESEAVLRVAATIGQALGRSAIAIFWGFILVGALAFAVVLGRPLLRWIGRRYEAKAFSDRGLTIDALFMVFAVTHSVFLSFQGAPWFLTGAVAFVAYVAAARMGFRARGDTTDRPLTLLLLRVFQLGARSEQFFDKLRRHWEEGGSISMVAGPDLVTALIEPDEFLDYLAGGLDRRFVSSGADLEARLGTADDRPDPDGRYRVNEFFCRADMWQATMKRLAAASDVVLMDLRSFSASNKGCLDEIGYLLDAVDLARVVFLVDASTDRGVLDSSLRERWRHVRADSPNLRAPHPTVRLFRIESQSERELVALLGHLVTSAWRSTGTGKEPRSRRVAAA